MRVLTRFTFRLEDILIFHGRQNAGHFCSHAFFRFKLDPTAMQVDEVSDQGKAQANAGPRLARILARPPFEIIEDTGLIRVADSKPRCR